MGRGRHLMDFSVPMLFAFDLKPKGFFVASVAH